MTLVDDDPNIRELIKDFLGNEGFKTDEAGDGKEALGGNYPDIIVLGAGDRNPKGMQNLQNGTMKATTNQDNKIFIQKMLDVCVDLADGIEITFDDPENRILDPQSISLMTAETLAAQNK